MCCYYYPPFARSGGMRSWHLARHLAARGWEVEVLTADPVLYASAIDPASTAVLSGEAPGVRVTRVACARPAAERHSPLVEPFVTLGDPWLREGRIIRDWVRAATAAALAILRARPETVLYVGAQPYASAAVGLEAAARLGTRWLIDLADPWTLDEVGEYTSRLHHWLQRRAFVRTLRGADAVVANTPDAGAAIRALAPEVADKLHVVPFGFDRGALPGAECAPPPLAEAFVLAHLGAIEVGGGATRRWNPLRYRPGATDLAARGTHYLLEALALVRAQRPELLSKLRIEVIATRTPHDVRVVEERGLGAHFAWTGVLPNREALARVACAHAALLLQQGAPAGHRLLTVRAKSYEYMALGKPILACVPAGDGADLVRRYGRAVLCEPGDPGAIAAGLLRLRDEHARLTAHPIEVGFVEAFEWGRLSERMDVALGRLAGPPPGAAPCA
jgi:glycosyltransferase involved in cell wall biosynthesis